MTNIQYKLGKIDLKTETITWVHLLAPQTLANSQNIPSYWPNLM